MNKYTLTRKFGEVESQEIIEADFYEHDRLSNNHGKVFYQDTNGIKSPIAYISRVNYIKQIND